MSYSQYSTNFASDLRQALPLSQILITLVKIGELRCPVEQFTGQHYINDIFVVIAAAAAAATAAAAAAAVVVVVVVVVQLLF